MLRGAAVASGLCRNTAHVNRTYEPYLLDKLDLLPSERKYHFSGTSQKPASIQITHYQYIIIYIFYKTDIIIDQYSADFRGQQSPNEKTEKSTPNEFFFPRVYQNLACGMGDRLFDQSFPSAHSFCNLTN